MGTTEAQRRKETKGRAMEVWTQAVEAAQALKGVPVPYPRVDLGTLVDVVLLREMAKLAEVKLDVYRYVAADGEWVVVEELFVRLGDVRITGSAWRPATPHDARLPARGGRA
jgi:hypothetical protein